MRVLVTGGAGFIGSNLALELQGEGAEVVVLDDFSSGSFENLAGFRGDVVTAKAQSDDWYGRIGGVDAIFHEAANTDTTVLDQRVMMEANVEGLRSVLRFADLNGVKRIVYASSAGVYGSAPCPFREDQEPTPSNVYGFSKAVGDSVARRYWAARRETVVVGLRYFNVYGPRESHKSGKTASMIWQLSRQMLAGKRPRIFKYGEQSRDFVYVKDVVAANLEALEADKSGIFNVGTGKDESFNAVIAELNRVLGLDLKPDYFDNPFGFYQNKTQAWTRKAIEDLSWEAEYSLAEGIADYCAHERRSEPAKAAKKPKKAVKV
jgi:ADP-L-glycero-D-manno-heptose 6-epimerase